MLQKLKITSSIALVVLFLLVTAHQSNASTQSQQSNTLTNFKHGYLPYYTVNSIDSEQTEIKLANSWGHHKKRMTKRRRYSTRYKNSQRYREWKQRKAARSRHHYRLRSVHRAYYKKIKRAERQVIRFQLSKRRTIKKLNARYKTNIKRINAQLEKVLAARKSRIKARRAKAEAAARVAAAKAQAESQARATAAKAKPVPLQAKPVPQQRRATQHSGGYKVYKKERRMAPVYTAKKKGEKLYSTHKTRKECIERLKKRTNGVWGERQAERFCGPCDSSKLINYHWNLQDSIIKNVCMPTWGYSCVKSKGCRGTPDLCQKSSQNGCYLNADYTIMKPQPKGTGDCNPSCLK